MTAVIQSTPMSAAVEYLALTKLRVAPWNARKTFDEASIVELASSIREHGILQPLTVRVLPISSWQSPADAEILADGGTLYEIVAGHRRLRAAQELEMETLPCLLRDLTDEQAREVGLVDNLQRENVPAMEEADAYEELRQTLGTAAAIAQRVGKDVAYVTRTLALVQLGDLSRRALAARLITVDHARVIAKLGAEEQELALGFALFREWKVRKDLAEQVDGLIEDVSDPDADPWDPKTVGSLKFEIERNLNLRLSRAPWDLADAALVATAGACTTCTKNTAANAALFGDLAIDGATCTDSDCFELKREAFVRLQVSAVQAAGVEALKLSWNESTSAPRTVKTSGEINLQQVFRKGQWIEAKQRSCPHVKTGVTVDYPKVRGYMGRDETQAPGMQLSVCVAAKCATHPKAWEKAKASPNRNDPAAQKADAERRQKAKAAAIAESKLRVAVASEAIEQVTKLPEAALREVLLFGGVRSDAHNALLPGRSKILQSKPVSDPLFAKAVAVLSIERLTVWAGDYNSDTPDAGRKEFLASLARLGYDGAKHWQQPKPEKKAAAKKAATKKATKKTAKKARRSA